MIYYKGGKIMLKLTELEIKNKVFENSLLKILIDFIKKFCYNIYIINKKKKLKKVIASGVVISALS